MTSRLGRASSYPVSAHHLKPESGVQALLKEVLRLLMRIRSFKLEVGSMVLPWLDPSFLKHSEALDPKNRDNCDTMLLHEMHSICGSQKKTPPQRSATSQNASSSVVCFILTPEVGWSPGS